MRTLKTEVGRQLQREREAERDAKRYSIPATRRTVAECYPCPNADEQANHMRRVDNPHVRTEEM